MASACCLPIVNSYPYRPGFEFNTLLSKSPAVSDSQPSGFATCSLSSTVDKPASMENHDQPQWEIRSLPKQGIDIILDNKDEGGNENDVNGLVAREPDFATSVGYFAEDNSKHP
ncbi:hypothetical protein GJ744_002571 [Endocarpon pusillum]|uniref:Uncharacterized protein n=1 Tax=Endocarpon pusillum TaxID=364733 RepID=A0A8H7DYR7_9EURO|nr:hypothetical protein GJ744_002571 [Endocarpon pusillum]